METFSKYMLVVFLSIIVSSCTVLSKPEYIYKINFSDNEHEKERELVRPFYAEDLEYIKKYPSLSDKYIKEPMSIDTFDLNDDGVKEIFVIMNSSFWCGSMGCHIALYGIKSSKKLEELAWYTYLGPIYILRNVTRGYHDIALESIGEAPDWKQSTSIFQWNGSGYEFSYSIPR